MDNKTISNSSLSNTVNVFLNIISLAADMINFLICLSCLSLILYRLKFHRRELKVDIPLILSINTCVLILSKSVLQSMHVSIPTLMKDFHWITAFNDTLFGRLRAYTLWSLIGLLYWNYTLFAFFRFTRVIYPMTVSLHRARLYLYVFLPAQLTFVFVCKLPLLIVFNGIRLLPDEAYCSIILKPFYYLTYSTVIDFVAPCSTIGVFYISIVRKIRQLPIIRSNQERNRKDLIVIRLMLFKMSILCIVALPYTVLYIIGLIRNNFDPVIYRVQWLSSSLASYLFLLVNPLISTQLKQCAKRTQVTPLENQR